MGCMCRVYRSTRKTDRTLIPPDQTGWPVFPHGAPLAIPAQGSGHDQAEVEPTLQAVTTQPDQAEVAPTLQAATGASDEAFDITVERFDEDGEDYVWTLRLTGFKTGQCISIFKSGQRGALHNHAIVDPTATQEVRAKASIFDLDKQAEYTFR